MSATARESRQSDAGVTIAYRHIRIEQTDIEVQPNILRVPLVQVGR